MYQQPDLGDRIVIIGRGGVDEFSAAERLATATGRPLIRIDKHFWPVDHRPQPAPKWAAVQASIASNDAWVMDADLGPFDIREPRLGHPDEIWILDFGPVTALLRALQRPAERRDLRVWLLRWRREYLTTAMKDFAEYAPEARVRRFTTPTEVAAALADVERQFRRVPDPS
jgi:hypothetical protein